MQQVGRLGAFSNPVGRVELNRIAVGNPAEHHSRAKLTRKAPFEHPLCRSATLFAFEVAREEILDPDRACAFDVGNERCVGLDAISALLAPVVERTFRDTGGFRGKLFRHADLKQCADLLFNRRSECARLSPTTRHDESSFR